MSHNDHEHGPHDLDSAETGYDIEKTLVSNNHVEDSQTTTVLETDTDKNTPQVSLDVHPCDAIVTPVTARTEPLNPPRTTTWDGEDDPQRPMNMSNLRKFFIVLINGLVTFSVTFGSSVFSTTIVVTSKEFGVSEKVMILGVSLYVLGFAFGPLIWGPSSELYGRTCPLWIGMILFCIFQIPVALGRNLSTIFICRFLSGLFGSAPLAIVGGMFVDFLDPKDRGMATAVYAAAAMAGPTCGPVIGSFITQSHLGWRWTAWISLIMSGFFLVLAWIVTPETSEAVLLARKARKLNQQTGNTALELTTHVKQSSLQVLFKTYLTKPLRMIVQEPILIALTIYTSLVYGILYLTFTAYPISFQIDRGWESGVASLPFLSLFVGVIIACVAVAVFTQSWYARRLARVGRPLPELRIPLMLGGAIVLPIGLFWFAWTSAPSMTWVPQVVSGLFIGAGIILVFNGCVAYLVDIYLLNANSAIAINTLIRSAAAAAFPLFAQDMYLAFGTAWATSLLGFICLAMVAFPVLFWFYGARIRSWSKFAP